MSISDTLNRVKRWYEEDENLRERVLEALLLFDLFRGPLRYDKKSAVSQTGVDENRLGIADIALKVPRKEKREWIIVEIKRPAQELRDSAVQQAGRYLASLGASRGVVTNGKVWIFIRTRLKPGAKYKYYADVLMRLRLEQDNPLQRKVLEKALERCARLTIRGFFETLEGMKDLGRDQIQRIMANHTPPDWVKAIAEEINKLGGSHFSSQDMSVLRLTCRDPGLFIRCLIGPFRTVVFATRRPKRNDRG